jgi:hypothetical protein
LLKIIKLSETIDFTWLWHFHHRIFVFTIKQQV